MKILIAGYGSIGRRHLQNLVALGEQDIILFRSFQSTLDDAEISEYIVETDIIHWVTGKVLGTTRTRIAVS